MRAETITWGDLVLRKEAIVGISMNITQFDIDTGIGTIKLYLIGGQTVEIHSQMSTIENDYKRLKSLASL